MSNKILVIGATGRVGSELVKLLIKNGESIRLATRNPSAVSTALKNTVEVVEFDYEKPQAFDTAVNGIEKIFLTVRPGDNLSDKFAMPLIDVAKKMMVQHIVDLTAMGVEHDDTFMLRILEKYIEASGIAFTHLRPNWFMQNFNSGPMFVDIKTTGALHLPADEAKISFIDTRDIAAVGFTALTQTQHLNKAYTLTGKESLSHFQVVEKLSNAAGKEYPYIPISEEIACTALSKRGFPQDLIERWADFYRKVREGLCAPISTDIESVLGRPPILFNQYANDFAFSWR